VHRLHRPSPLPTRVSTASGRADTADTAVASVTALALALVFVALSAAVASAHSAIAPSSVEAGTPTDFTLTILHGCAPGEPPPGPGETVSPTNEVSVRLPERTRDVTGIAPDGWNVEATATDGRAVVTWSGDELPPEEVGEFMFTAALYGDEGDRLAFEVFQGCVEGAYRWVQVDEADSADGDPLDQPAPLVELETGAPAPEPVNEATEPVARGSAPSPLPEQSPAQPSSDATPDPAPDDEGAGATRPAPGAAPAVDGTATEEPEASSDGDGPMSAVVAAVLVIALGGAAVAARRRGSG
jgi:uncharacterized protein YcnI